MKKIDSYLLGKCQSISDWAQDFAGITNFFIVKYIISTLLVLNESWYIVFKTAIKHEGDLFMYVSSAIVVLYASIRIPSLANKIEAAVSSNPTFKNPLEEIVSDFRQQQLLPIVIFFLMFSIIYYVSFAFFLNSTIFWVCALLVGYFLCCTPKPPSKSKLKKLKEKISSISFSLPRSSPEPSLG